MSNSISIVITTVEKLEEAQEIGEMLIRSKLAACIQQININSRYLWNEVVQTEPEILMLIKTTNAKSKLVMEEIVKVHSYDLPEVLVIDTSSSLAAYAEWVLKETGGP